MHDDLLARRSLFPAADRYTYLNHAGLCPVPTTVVEATHAAIRSQCDDGLVHIERWEEGVERVRGRAAELVGCSSSEITFVRNTSHGLSLVAAGVDWRPGDVVLCATTEEYPSNVYPWMRLASRGVELRTVPAPGGRVTADAFAQASCARTRMIVVSTVQYATGLRTDLAALGQLCRDRGWLLSVDGIQSLGLIPCDAKALGVHFLSADAHKWMLGPAGIGVMYVSEDAPLDPVLVGWRSTKDALNFDRVELDLREDAARFEEGSLCYAAIAGMGAAIDLLLDVGVARIWERVQGLNDVLADRLRAVGHEVSEQAAATRSGALTFVPRAGDPAEWATRLGEQGVIVSARRGRLRASPHFYNSEDDLERLVDAVSTQP
ncbi:MAG: aminotransferase class V-fold PLP-dependent enzyme [Myxococcales bacterium]|nr:aminotransferase class V-fold PLP-dependent enzyme [Myxococcales bacterium]